MLSLVTLTSIQDRYIETVNAGIARWKHRKDGGHTPKIIRGAHNTAVKQLTKLGFSQEFISVIIDEARQVAKLQRDAIEDDNA